MNKILTAATMVALVLTAVPGAVSADQERTEVSQIVATSDGLELVPGSTVPLGMSQEECEATAPDETYCDTGLHVASQTQAISAFAGFTYTGTIESRVYHLTGLLMMQVHVIDGNVLGGDIYGEFPAGASVLLNECFSYELGEADTDPLPLPGQANGTPGGSGLWGCGVLYA